MTKEQELRAAEGVARQASRAAEHELSSKPSRPEVVRLATVASLVVSLLLSGFAIAVSVYASDRSGQVALQQEVDRQAAAKDRQLAQEAYASAQTANAQLERRGQPSVPVPNSNSSDLADSVAALAAAKVLTALPSYRPTAAELGKAVADYLIVNPIAPASPGQILTVLAKYFADNPLIPGPKGDPGEQGEQGPPGDAGPPGRAPTEGEIQSAFADYVIAHPDFLPAMLCSGRGAFSEARNLAVDGGGSISGYLCVTASTPAATPTSSTTTSATTTETTP